MYLNNGCYGYLHANVTTCILNNDLSPDAGIDINDTLNINSYCLMTQYSLNAVGYMLLYITVYVKALMQWKDLIVIGIFFAI